MSGNELRAKFLTFDPVQKLTFSRAERRSEFEHRNRATLNQVIDLTTFGPIAEQELSDLACPPQKVARERARRIIRNHVSSNNVKIDIYGYKKIC